jgi:hypothetical protein
MSLGKARGALPDAREATISILSAMLVHGKEARFTYNPRTDVIARRDLLPSILEVGAKWKESALTSSGKALISLRVNLSLSPYVLILTFLRLAIRATGRSSRLSSPWQQVSFSRIIV